MNDVKFSIEGSSVSVSKGTSLSQIVPDVKNGTRPVFARVDGAIVDLDWTVEDDARVDWIYPDSQEALDILRHSTAHLLAQAVLDLFPGTQTGVGPAVENGFYYDFLKDTPFTPDDLGLIEKRMRELAEEDFQINKETLDKDAALRMFREMNHDLKEELVQEKGGDKVSCYRQGNFIDFCRGPHVPSTGLIRHFKIVSVSGAYWKGEEKGKQLQRIYGTVFFSREDLDHHLELIEEAKRRDHRKLGTELDLFSFHEDLGAGLILWHPKGGAVRRVIEDFWRDEHFKAGYDLLFSPHIAKLDVWKRSGHTEFYDAMYPTLESDEVEYELKPMNCPFHIMVYNSRQRSYRDLPLRWAELGTVYRHERSGVLHGLMRVRGFTQDDAHIFCRPDQLEKEIQGAVRLALSMLKTFGFSEFDVYLSTRPEKYVGNPEDWVTATKALEDALRSVGLEFREDIGEGVFYGPKIDIKIRDALQRSWQCTTVQLDFNLAERFNIHYVGEDGGNHRPFMIHRALLGSLERFFGVLIEHYNGNFPLWLAPVQIVILPIADRHNDYADRLNARFIERGLRSQVDRKREKIGYKIRHAEMQKIPLILIVGDKEVQDETVSPRIHTIGDKGQMPVKEFLEKVDNLVENKSLVLDL
ncbi:MAG: threonine--tRNA ligase [Acidobacteria bacterium]|nr:threonine--tRNA ligase [Acidobacteriota bacterium]MBU4494755.1 threonine--tRNA ligase [Acidobacteriota bacterium]MCG2816238.1 threonine--tRNA ligase [Candidatus Aminicenantes bacterium]